MRAWTLRVVYSGEEVLLRILRGESMSAADYIDLLGARKSLIARAAARLAPYDAIVLPTTANTPPRIADAISHFCGQMHRYEQAQRQLPGRERMQRARVKRHGGVTLPSKRSGTKHGH